jgi:hypothetical protein
MLSLSYYILVGKKNNVICYAKKLSKDFLKKEKIRKKNWRKQQQTQVVDFKCHFLTRQIILSLEQILSRIFKIET